MEAAVVTQTNVGAAANQDKNQSVAKCKDLQEQLQRNESFATADIDAKPNQEKELSAAAEKLAECQETIFLLGKQLKGLRPQTERVGSPYSERTQRSSDGFTEEEPTPSGMNLPDLDQTEMDSPSSPNLQRVGSESPMDHYNPTIFFFYQPTISLCGPFFSLSLSSSTTTQKRDLSLS
ncbi:unnamed protein product [Camellia sinensis]